MTADETKSRGDWMSVVDDDLHGGWPGWNIALKPKSGGFWFLRHGRTASNHKGVIQGHADIPLDEVGRAQAVAAGRLLRGAGITRVISSDLSRSRETARLAALELGIAETAVDPGLRERHFGSLEGAVTPAEAWMSRAEDVETLQRFAARTIAGIVMAASEPGMLISAHGGNLRILSAATGLRFDTGHYENGVPLRFDLARGVWTVRRVE
jgi:broad specificity phosphatase PhoE